MARKSRGHFPGALYHVMGRGNQGQSIFKDDRDRERYLEFPKEGEKRFSYRLYAYVPGTTILENFLIAREKTG